jgi:hypothetical protein
MPPAPQAGGGGIGALPNPIPPFSIAFPAVAAVFSALVRGSVHAKIFNFAILMEV